MKNCPDIITIQAVLDGEEKDERIIKHIQTCPTCCSARVELEESISLAECLNSPAVLPDVFCKQLTERIQPKPFPAILVSAAIFLLSIISAYLLNPGYLQWWLSVGIINQFSYIMDVFISFLYFSHYIGPLGLITGLVSLVVVEVLILNKLRTVEGYNNV